jgi:hypothetical protein
MSGHHLFRNIILSHVKTGKQRNYSVKVALAPKACEFIPGEVLFTHDSEYEDDSLLGYCDI